MNSQFEINKDRQKNACVLLWNLWVKYRDMHKLDSEKHYLTSRGVIHIVERYDKDISRIFYFHKISTEIKPHRKGAYLAYWIRGVQPISSSNDSAIDLLEINSSFALFVLLSVGLHLDFYYTEEIKEDDSKEREKFKKFLENSEGIFDNAAYSMKYRRPSGDDLHSFAEVIGKYYKMEITAQR